MEPHGTEKETSSLEDRFKDQSESSTTEESSGIYQYYPHIDFMNSTTKVQSRLGRRRTTLNPFRFSTSVAGDLSEINHSKRSIDDSCSDNLSHEILVRPSLSDKTDVKTKNIAVMDQENYPAPSPCLTNERHGFKNVSNSMKIINAKVASPFSQEKHFSSNFNKSDNPQSQKSVLNTDKADGKLNSAFYLNNPIQFSKTPLKPNTDNIFTGSATKVNTYSSDQSNLAKNLFGSKNDAIAKKENLNIFDSLGSTKKSTDVFSRSHQNERKAINLSKKFESQNVVKVKQADAQFSLKNSTRATTLDDLPLDLKLKFKSGKSNSANIFSSSNLCSNNLSAEAPNDSNRNQPLKLKLNVDSGDFINILEMPSVQRNQDFNSPSESISSKSLQSQVVKSNFKEPAIPVKKHQSLDRSPQEPTDLEIYSALNLSMDNSLKTVTSQANSSSIENKVSPQNQLNVTDINTASFIPNSNSSFLLGSEKVHKGPIRNDSSCLSSSGSDYSSSSVSQNLSARNPTNVLNVELVTNHKQEEEKKINDKMFNPSRPNIPTNVNSLSTPHQSQSKSSPPTTMNTDGILHPSTPNIPINNAFPSNLQLNSKAVLPVTNKLVSSLHSKSDTRHEAFQHQINYIENQTPKKDIKSTSGENDALPNFNARNGYDNKLQAQEVFKKSLEPVISQKTSAPEFFKKPPPQASSTNLISSAIPVAVSQAPVINSNFVLPKVNTRPPKSTYSFASDVAKFCRKEGEVDVKLRAVKGPSPSQSSFKVIKVNNKSYHILSTLGRGGSSEVYQVLDPSTNALLAVKCVKLASVDESIAEGYMNEVKLLEKLQGCSSVICMFDYEYFQDSKKLFVVMEKGDIDLSRLLKDINKMKKISISKIIGYWEEMLTAVQEIHAKGIIHSDLKPANFLLVCGRLKLIDFGIASSLQGDMTSVHKDICAGTENYMSPEAIQGGAGGNDKKYKISYKSDVWSLGCILYNMLYGKTPFSHITSRWSKMYAIISSSHKIEFPDHPMPPVLRSALQSCLIRDPKLRPSVKDLLDLPYHDVASRNGKNLPLQVSQQTIERIQQNIHEECWLKIAHLFADPGKQNS